MKLLNRSQTSTSQLLNWEWTSSFTPNNTGHAITYPPTLGLLLIHASERAPGSSFIYND